MRRLISRSAVHSPGGRGGHARRRRTLLYWLIALAVLAAVIRFLKPLRFLGEALSR